MADNSVVEQTNLVVENQTNNFVNNELLKPHEAFGKYVSNLIPSDSLQTEQVAGIQEAGRLFNKEATEARKITLLYHFTDATGAQGISENGIIGKDEKSKTYLTAITPDIAKPLSSTSDAEGFEKYFKTHEVPQSLHEHINRFILGVKFKWSHEIQKKMLNRPIVPVGEDKLENALILAVSASSSVLKKDNGGEIYVDRQINIHSDPDLQVFGPYNLKSN
jgi:hypothetical protein